MREFFTRLAGALAADPVPLDPAGSAAGAAVAGRWPALAVSPWELAAAVTMGSLLSPLVVFRRVRPGVPPPALA